MRDLPDGQSAHAVPCANRPSGYSRRNPDGSIASYAPRNQRQICRVPALDKRGASRSSTNVEAGRSGRGGVVDELTTKADGGPWGPRRPDAGVKFSREAIPAERAAWPPSAAHLGMIAR